MRVLRGMASLAVLVLGLVGGPIVLMTTAQMVAPRRLLQPEVWLRPDDGTVLLTVLWVAGWLMWAMFAALVVTEALGIGTSRRGWLRGPRMLVASLLMSVLALAPHQQAQAAPPPQHGTSDAVPRREAPPEREVFVMHTVERGESLWTIAEQHYGDGGQWRRIAEANPRLADPDGLEIGQELRIPGIHRLDEAPVAVASTPGPTPPTPDPDLPQADAAEVPGTPEDLTSRNPITVAPSDVGLDVIDPVELEAARNASDPDATGVGDGPAQQAALLLAGAHVGLLASTGLAALWRRRREVQLATRPLGRRITHPPEEADDLVAVRDPESVAALDLVLRAVGAWCGVEVPGLRHVVATAEAIRVTFADGAPPPPDWATRDGAAWVIASETSVPDAAAHNPWPALVSVGRGLGGELFIDLEADTQVLSGAGPVVAEFLDGWILDTITSPWADDLDVLVVGEHRGVDAAEVAHVRCISADELRAACAGVDTEPGRADAMAPAERRRRRAAGEDADRAKVLICPDPADHARLAPMAQRMGMSVVGASTGPARLRVEPPPDFSLLPDGTAFVARTVPAEVGTMLADAFDAVNATATDPAPWWFPTPDADHATLPRAPQRPEPELPSNVVRIHPDRTMPRPHPPTVLESVDVNTDERIPSHPVVQLLGPVDLLGARGEVPQRARRSCVEMAAWLVEHSGATARQMSRDLFVVESTRRSNLSRLRKWLGRDDEGKAYLPEAHTGRVTLSTEVMSDWHQVQLYTFTGVNRSSTPSLISALELVRGAPLADAAPTQWQWAEVMRTDALSCIRDIGVELTARALADGDIDLARWAAGRALVAVGDDEQLLCARIRTEMRAGNHREVPRLAMRLTRQARSLNVDLHDDTITLVQEAMEGVARGSVG